MTRRHGCRLNYLFINIIKLYLKISKLKLNKILNLNKRFLINNVLLY